MSDAIGRTCVPSPDGHCSICADEATVWCVTAIDDTSATADVARDGMTMTVGVELLEHVALGDLVLVHTGFAISVIHDGSVA